MQDCVISKSLLSMIFLMFKDLYVQEIRKICLENGIIYYKSASQQEFTVLVKLLEL